ncbi:MAG TPA: hypothetical protein VGB30_12035 [bacterium]
MVEFIIDNLLCAHPVFLVTNYSSTMDFSVADVAVWKVFGVLGTAMWIMIMRYVAEEPGRQHGNMTCWWLLFSFLHVLGFLFYALYLIIGRDFQHQKRMEKRRRFDDFPSRLGRAKPPLLR